MELRAAGKATVWWDMESCPLPPSFHPYIVTSMGPALLHKFNIMDVNTGRDGCRSLNDFHFSAYEFFSPVDTELYQTIFNSGIRLHQLPPGNRNEMEKMMIADVLLWAMDTPPPADIIFIVGSVDFCHLFQKLRQRSYNVFLVCQSVSEMTQDMLGGVNDCLEWLSFLRSLQNEDHQSHFPRGISVYDHTFSNTAFPTSSSNIHKREMGESNKKPSGFKYSREFLFSLRPSLSGGWNTTCSIPLDEMGNSPVQTDPGSYGQFTRIEKPRSPVTSSSNIHKREMEESNKKPSGFKHSREFLFSLRPSLSGGWNTTCSLPLDEMGNSLVQTDPGFYSQFTRIEKPSSPVTSASSTEKDKSASLEEFKAWLTQVVNGKKHAENGYYIGTIHRDFWKATGKILDEKLLGFSDIRNLVEECKDIAALKELNRGCHLAFTVKPKEQNKNPMFSPGGVNPNPRKKVKSKEKPKAETDSTRKPKASAEDFREFICHMLLAGEFSQGFLMSRLPQRFEQHTGKFLDVEHLGYKKMSAFVASFGHLVSVCATGPGPVRIFPSGFINDPVPNFYPNSNTIKENPINSNRAPINLNAKVEANRPSSGGSGKELLKNRTAEENNFNEQLPYINSEYESLPSMISASRASMNCSPCTEENSPTFQEYNSIMSDSSSTRTGSQVREREGQSSNTIFDTTSFHKELAESDFLKEHFSTSLWESNNPIEEVSVNPENLMAETMQNMSLMKETTSFCGEPSIHGDKPGLPDLIPPPSQSPGSELQADYNSSLADPLQTRSRAESSAFCTVDLKHDIRLDCKQNEQSTNSAGYEERSVTSAVSPAESIIQIAARVLNSICEPTMWRKNR